MQSHVQGFWTGDKIVLKFKDAKFANCFFTPFTPTHQEALPTQIPEPQILYSFMSGSGDCILGHEWCPVQSLPIEMYEK